MSTSGGDSWAREAQYRKRRVDDLLIDDLNVDTCTSSSSSSSPSSSSSSSFKKLSNGKFACLVCPHNPILDSPLMCSTHSKGSCHRAAASKMEEKELWKRDQMNKRIALSDCSTVKSSPGFSLKNRTTSKPLIEQTRSAASEILSKKTSKQHAGIECSNAMFTRDAAAVVAPTPTANYSCCANQLYDMEATVQQQLHCRERREKELKFTAAGWKRDGNGRWYKDENVEFDSDEEDPNICLA